MTCDRDELTSVLSALEFSESDLSELADRIVQSDIDIERAVAGGFLPPQRGMMDCVRRIVYDMVNGTTYSQPTIHLEHGGSTLRMVQTYQELPATSRPT